MAALPFSFRNYAKSEASPIHSLSRMAKTYRDVRQILIKKVPHRVKQFTPYGRSEQGASIGHRGTPYGDSRRRAKSMRLSHLVNRGENRTLPSRGRCLHAAGASGNWVSR